MVFFLFCKQKVRLLVQIKLRIPFLDVSILPGTPRRMERVMNYNLIIADNRYCLHLYVELLVKNCESFNLKVNTYSCFVVPIKQVSTIPAKDQNYELGVILHLVVMNSTQK